MFCFFRTVSLSLVASMLVMAAVGCGSTTTSSGKMGGKMDDKMDGKMGDKMDGKMESKK